MVSCVFIVLIMVGWYSVIYVLFVCSRFIFSNCCIGGLIVFIVVNI